MFSSLPNCLLNILEEFRLFGDFPTRGEVPGNIKCCGGLVQSIFQSQLHFNSCFQHNYPCFNALQINPSGTRRPAVNFSMLIRIPSAIADISDWGSLVR